LCYRLRVMLAWADLTVEVIRGDIIVSHALSGVKAEYYKPANEPQLILRRRTPTNDYALLARIWEAANHKARELGWIV
jgi:hypothetical protein